MIAISKTINNPMVQQGKNLFVKKAVNNINYKNLRFLPSAMFSDVVELKEKFFPRKNAFTVDFLQNLLKSGKKIKEIAQELNIPYIDLRDCLANLGLIKLRKPCSPDVIIKEKKLRKLIDKGLTLDELASKLKVSVGKVRYYMMRYNLSNLSDEVVALKKYLCASNQEKKEKAFLAVDKFLQQIAKEEAKIRKNSSYEDCLQDVRLRFLELEKKREHNPCITSGNILQMVKEQKPTTPEKILNVPIETAQNLLYEAGNLSQRFEDKDYMDYLLDNAKLTERKRIFLDMHMRKDRPVEEIAEKFDLTRSRVNELLKEAREAVAEKHKKVSSEEYIKQRAEFGKRAEKVLITK